MPLELMRNTALALALLVASSAAASDLEQLLLPVGPSVVHCAYDSRYETRLLAFNLGADRAERVCMSAECREVAPMVGQEFTGGYAGGLPAPLWVYLPREAARKMRLSLVVESAQQALPAERFFTEVPVVRASDFTTEKMEFIGVRVDPGFRQAVRIYGLTQEPAVLMMHIYSQETGAKLHECLHEIVPLSSELTAEGLPLRPSYGMECDMSENLERNGQRVRVEIEPLTPGLKYWAFLSVTNNKTQHFYTVTAR